MRHCIPVSMQSQQRLSSAALQTWILACLRISDCLHCLQPGASTDHTLIRPAAPLHYRHPPKQTYLGFACPSVLVCTSASMSR